MRKLKNDGPGRVSSNQVPRQNRHKRARGASTKLQLLALSAIGRFVKGVRLAIVG